MNKVCSVCGEGYNSPENSLFICEGRGCHVGVHQGLVYAVILSLYIIAILIAFSFFIVSR